MKNGPDLWDAILAHVRRFHSYRTIIAGGCVRDYILGVPTKDIDVWLNLNCPAPTTSPFRLTNTPLRYGSRGELIGTLFDHTVNIISMPSPSSDDLVWKFDLGINRSWYDGEMHDTDEALKDRTDQSLTILRRDDAAATWDRIHRIQLTEWGSDYKVVDPYEGMATGITGIGSLYMPGVTTIALATNGRVVADNRISIRADNIRFYPCG